MANVITDATPWIAYLSGKDSAILELALAAGSVRVPPLVAVELLGNKLPFRERKALSSVIEPLVLGDLPAGHWSRAAELKARLDQLDISVSARDAHILQCALDQNALLISDDPLFLKIQKTTGVQVQIW